MGEPLLPSHGGFRRLKSFQMARLVYDFTERFCGRYIERQSRTRDQMVQAARSGVQNIAEGSCAAGTSKKTELKLTNVARASLEELRLDYEDFLRQQSFSQWAHDDWRRSALIARRCGSVEEVATCIAEMHRHGSTYRELAANAGLTLIVVACSLLDRQITALADTFEKEGGFTERLYRQRATARRQTPFP
jgi:four helix bundle suffix protein